MNHKYLVSIVTPMLLLLSGMAHANGSLQHFSNAVDHSAQAVAHSSAAGIKLVSGAVAIPLMIGGEIGKASGDIGEALWDDANTPLLITDDVMTIGPSPAKAMKDEETNR
jgi:hypothetical protein